jgi:release factor glutamine methyltransferase
VFTCRHVEDAHLEAEVLLRHILGVSRAQLYADLQRESTHAETSRYRQLVERRLAGEPAAYITGHREFYRLDFAVDCRVLIPRPESELLVDKAVEMAGRGASFFADIGTGSGALAISLAVNASHVNVYATDMSKGALQVALSNCRKHGVERVVHLLEGDLTAPLPEPVDVIMANLPYVMASELSLVNTSGFEPALALDGGRDGLDQLRRMAERFEARLRPGGTLLLEIGQGQAEGAVQILRRQTPGAIMDITADLAGIPRVLAVTPAA